MRALQSIQAVNVCNNKAIHKVEGRDRVSARMYLLLASPRDVLASLNTLTITLALTQALIPTLIQAPPALI